MLSCEHLLLLTDTILCACRAKRKKKEKKVTRDGGFSPHRHRFTRIYHTHAPGCDVCSFWELIKQHAGGLFPENQKESLNCKTSALSP